MVYLRERISLMEVNYQADAIETLDGIVETSLAAFHWVRF